MPPTALAQRRACLDIGKIMELADAGIFYIADEVDMMHGWAIICGCEGTPYYGAPFCFEVRLPDNYPFEPPAFTYLTNDSFTRFNPNLYRDGKVCLSLLNTWQGEKWSSVQTLGAILQIIQADVLCDNPLTREPTYPAAALEADHPVYNRMIFHASLETAILGQLVPGLAWMEPAHDAVMEFVKKARPTLIAKAQELSTWDGKKEKNTFYNMSIKYQFGELAERLASL
jgi:ubiquitin-protein ligase